MDKNNNTNNNTTNEEIQNTNTEFQTQNNINNPETVNPQTTQNTVDNNANRNATEVNTQNNVQNQQPELNVNEFNTVNSTGFKKKSKAPIILSILAVILIIALVIFLLIKFKVIDGDIIPGQKTPYQILKEATKSSLDTDLKENFGTEVNLRVDTTPKLKTMLGLGKEEEQAENFETAIKEILTNNAFKVSTVKDGNTIKSGMAIEFSGERALEVNMLIKDEKEVLIDVPDLFKKPIKISMEDFENANIPDISQEEIKKSVEIIQSRLDNLEEKLDLEKIITKVILITQSSENDKEFTIKIDISKLPEAIVDVINLAKEKPEALQDLAEILVEFENITKYTENGEKFTDDEKQKMIEEYRADMEEALNEAPEEMTTEDLDDFNEEIKDLKMITDNITIKVVLNEDEIIQSISADVNLGGLDMVQAQIPIEKITIESKTTEADQTLIKDIDETDVLNLENITDANNGQLKSQLEENLDLENFTKKLMGLKALKPLELEKLIAESMMQGMNSNNSNTLPNYGQNNMNQEKTIEDAIKYAETTISTGMYYSRDGLIRQLEFMGIDTNTAEQAVDSMNIDWNQMAANDAQRILSTSDYTKEQVENILKTRNYTEQEIAYALSTLNID